MVSIDMVLEPRARRRLAIDVDFLNVDVRLSQITSGVLARRSRRLPVERRFGHMQHNK
jgi:hypothetical protein